jgi:hypothetical protein
MAPRVAALGEAVDPFAAPPSTGTAPMAQLPSAPLQQRLDASEPEVALGLPRRKPEWLLPVVVGLLALVVGGAVTLVVMTH